MRRATLITLLIIALLLAACAPAPPAPTPTAETTDAPLTPIRLSLGYIPDVQFAPFYVGMEKGIFAEHGIELTTEHRQETDGARLVATGEIKFAVLSGEQVLLARQQDLPLVYVFEWYRRFPVAVAAKEAAGIDSPAALAGKRVGTPVKEGASYIGLEAMLHAAGLTDDDITLETTGYSQVETLLTDRVDAVVVYLSNEPVYLEAAGEAVTVLPVADSVDLVGNGLVTSEETLENNPELVRSMAAALAESITYTIEHPDEAFTISQNYVEGLSDPANEANAREVLARSIALWEGEPIGHSDMESWEAMQGVLLDMGLLDASLELGPVFTNDFLPGQ